MKKGTQLDKGLYISFVTKTLKAPHRQIANLLLSCSLLLMSGCGTVPSTYIPKQIGAIPWGNQASPIEVLIIPNQDVIALGDVLYFTVIIRNQAPYPIWIPRTPHVVLTWVYPNGDRDNFLREFPSSEFFSEQTAILLQPRQQMNRTIAVKTYYFPTTGITEFRALLHSPVNTNPALNPFFSGQLKSNAYGILVQKKRKRKSAAYETVISSAAERALCAAPSLQGLTTREQAGTQRGV